MSQETSDALTNLENLLQQFGSKSENHHISTGSQLQSIIENWDKCQQKFDDYCQHPILNNEDFQKVINHKEQLSKDNHEEDISQLEQGITREQNQIPLEDQSHPIQKVPSSTEDLSDDKKQISQTSIDQENHSQQNSQPTQVLTIQQDQNPQSSKVPINHTEQIPQVSKESVSHEEQITQKTQILNPLTEQKDSTNHKDSNQMPTENLIDPKKQKTNQKEQTPVQS